MLVMHVLDRLSLLPLVAEKLDCCRNEDLAIAVASALEAYILVVTHKLEGAESVNIVVESSVLSRHSAMSAAGDVNVLEILFAC